MGLVKIQLFRALVPYLFIVPAFFRPSHVFKDECRRYQYNSKYDLYCFSDFDYVYLHDTGACYGVFTKPKNFTGYVEECKNRDGWPLEINSFKVYQKILDRRINTPNTRMKVNNSLWIGLTDIDQEGTFRWYTSKKPPASFVNNLLVNVNENSREKNCVAIDSKDGKMRLHSCDDSLYIICESMAMPRESRPWMKSISGYTVEAGKPIQLRCALMASFHGYLEFAIIKKGEGADIEPLRVEEFARPQIYSHSWHTERFMWRNKFCIRRQTAVLNITKDLAQEGTSIACTAGGWIRHKFCLPADKTCRIIGTFNNGSFVLTKPNKTKFIPGKFFKPQTPAAATDKLDIKLVILVCGSLLFILAAITFVKKKCCRTKMDTQEEDEEEVKIKGVSFDTPAKSGGRVRNDSYGSSVDPLDNANEEVEKGEDGEYREGRYAYRTSIPDEGEATFETTENDIGWSGGSAFPNEDF